jgi:hypothetical protein
MEGPFDRLPTSSAERAVHRAGQGERTAYALAGGRVTGPRRRGCTRWRCRTDQSVGYQKVQWKCYVGLANEWDSDLSTNVNVANCTASRTVGGHLKFGIAHHAKDP